MLFYVIVSRMEFSIFMPSALNELLNDFVLTKITKQFTKEAISP